MRSVLSLFGVFSVAAIAWAADPPPAFDFPDPLTMADGTKVTTKEQWETRRKPELKQLFQKHMYGVYPFTPTKPSAKVLFEDAKAFGGLGTLKEVELRLFDAPKAPPADRPPEPAAESGRAGVRRAELQRQPQHSGG
jgi:hypothetical protein